MLANIWLKRHGQAIVAWQPPEKRKARQHACCYRDLASSEFEHQVHRKTVGGAMPVLSARPKCKPIDPANIRARETNT
jgi:hypothetical protein